MFSDNPTIRSLQKAKAPEDATTLLQIIVPLAYHTAIGEYSHADKVDTLSFLCSEWYLKKVRTHETQTQEYSSDGYDVCVSCRAVFGSGTSIRRHCSHCCGYALWNHLWFLDYIAEKLAVHPALLETLLSMYIRKRYHGSSDSKS